MRFLLLLGSLYTFCQGLSQNIQWMYSYNSAVKSVEIEAILAEGWHLYSQYIDSDSGPVATSIKFEPTKFVRFIGKVEEPTPIRKFDETFGTELSFFEKNALFRQQINYSSPTILKGSVIFMLCNDTMCLPPEETHFSIELK